MVSDIHLLAYTYSLVSSLRANITYQLSKYPTCGCMENKQNYKLELVSYNKTAESLFESNISTNEKQ